MKYIFTIFLLLQVVFGQDQKPLIEVRSSVDTSLITIGDRITYTVSIDHKAGMRVEQPGAGVNLGQFEIKNYKIQPPYTEDDRVHIKYEYEISVFDTGRFIIPPFPVAYFPTDSTKDYKIIEANPINIYVESVIQDDTKELKDVKPPVNIPFDYAFVATLAVIIIALLLAAFLAYRFYRNKKESGHLFKAPDPKRPAHESALTALEELLGKNLPENGEVKQYYIELSEIIRRYIEERFFIPALEETSFEILSEMKNQELEKDLHDTLARFLEVCDLAKFAKYKPPDKSHAENAENARQFINETKIEIVISDNQDDADDNKSRAEVA